MMTIKKRLVIGVRFLITRPLITIMVLMLLLCFVMENWISNNSYLILLCFLYVLHRV